MPNTWKKTDNLGFFFKNLITHPRRHPGVTDGAVDLVTGGAPAEPGQDHDPADDVRHRRPQREDHLQHHERERQLHLFHKYGQPYLIAQLKNLWYCSLGIYR